MPTFGPSRSPIPPARPRRSPAGAAVAGTGLPVQMVSCGVPFLFVPLATRRAVDSASLDARPTRLHARGRARELAVFLFSHRGGGRQGDGLQSHVRARTSASRRIRPPAAPAGRWAAIWSPQVVRPAKRRRDTEPAGRQDGTPEPRPHCNRRRNGEIIGVRVGGEAVLAGEGKLYVCRVKK